MPVKSQGAFPAVSLRDLDGVERSLADAWKDGDALVVLGHRGCKTTRQTLPYVDRIHRRRGKGHAVLAVLQDDADTARALVSSLDLSVPLVLEADPYPLAAELALVTVPTLFLVNNRGGIESVSEGFSRADLESFADRLDVSGPLFTPEDKAPALRPG